MSTDKLIRTALLEHAGDVRDEDLLFRGGAVRRRARARQRRQAVAGVAAAALVVPLTLAAMLGGNPFGTAQELGPSDQDTRAVFTVPQQFAGRTLIRSDVVEGGNELLLTATAQRGSQWLATCAGIDGSFTLHQTLDGAFERTAPCSQVAPEDGTLSFRFNQSDPAGQDRRMRMWITRTGEGTAVTPPDAVLVAAVYALPDPVAIVAGSDILPLERDTGQLWSYLRHVESSPGDRSVTTTLEAADSPRMLELVTSGSGAQVRFVVDGEVQDVTAGQNPGIFDLGSANEGYTLEPGPAHTVTLTVVGTVPADASLGIVVRTPVP